MSRAKGDNKWRTDLRNAAEAHQFNSRLMRDDLDMLLLLLNQEIRRREFPSEALTRSLNLAHRLKDWNGENVEEARKLLLLLSGCSSD